MTTPNASATAHRAWEQIWQSADGRADWLVPEQEVLDQAAAHYERGGRAALDLGCGVGRHATALAALGYRVTAIDASTTGLSELARAAADQGLSINTLQAPMTNIPVPDASQDYVLAWNVIYHGDPDIVRRTVAEITRILRPGGIYQGTMLTKRNKHFRVGEELTTDTWVDASDGGDKAHPHFYCDAASLCALFPGFEIISLVQTDQGKPRHWHWHLVVEKHPA